MGAYRNLSWFVCGSSIFFFFDCSFFQFLDQMVFDRIFLVSNAGDSMAKYNGGYLVETVFDNSKLGWFPSIDCR